MSPAAEPYQGRDLLNRDRGLLKQQVTRSLHALLEHERMRRNTHGLAERAFEVAGGPSWFRYPPQKNSGDVLDLRDSLTEY